MLNYLFLQCYVDRITKIDNKTGEFKGIIKAELDIKDNLCFLIVIFRESVMPGCLGLDDGN